MIWNQRNRNRYNHKAILIVFLLICLISFGAFLMFPHTRSTQTLTTKLAAASQSSFQDNTSIDSDGDNLKDWEEIIYGTNLHNIDSDGDGTNDGDEITQSRNPLISGPNDIVTKKAASTVATQDNQDKLNLSKKIAAIFTQDYLLRLVQNPLEEINLDDISDKIAQTALENSGPRAPTLTTNDIIILRDASNDDIKNYMDKFIHIAKTAAEPLSDKKNSIQAVGDFTQNQDDSMAIKSLTERIDIADVFLRDIKKLPIPEDFVALHLNYLNTSIREGEAVKKILDIKNDVFLAIVGIQEFIQMEVQFRRIVQNYRDLLAHKGITFETQ